MEIDHNRQDQRDTLKNSANREYSITGGAFSMSNFRFLYIAAAFVLAAPIPITAQGIGTVEYNLNYGRDYLAAGNPSSAATYFRLAVSLHPDSAEAHLLLAVALQRSGKLAEARSYLEKAISLDPKVGMSTDGRMVAQALQQSDASDAPQSALPDGTLAAPKPQTAGPVGSEYDNATFGGGGPGYDIKRGREELALGGYDHAETYFRLALRKDPQNAAANFLLGAAMRGAGKEADAQAALRRAIQIDPSLARRTAEWPSAPPPKVVKAPSANTSAPARPMTCDEIYGSCTATATGAAKNMCFVRRNQCKAALGR